MSQTQHAPTRAAPQAAEPVAPRRSHRLGALLRDVLEAVVLAVVLFGLLQVALQNTVVSGSSMTPSLVDGQRLLVNKLAYRRAAPERGDVIVFRRPGESREYIKRVIGLPGEEVAMRRGVIYIDGQPLDEPWQPRRSRDRFGPFVVPPDQVFVLGDNRPGSNDSRSWRAALPHDQIVGRAWLSIWPQGMWGAVRSDAPGPGAVRPRAAQGR